MDDISDWSRDELESVAKTHFELCEKLHENESLIVEQLKDKIHDLVYSYYEP